MSKKQTAQLHPPKEGISKKLAFLKVCLKFVSLLTMLLSAINKCWDALNKLFAHLP